MTFNIGFCGGWNGLQDAVHSKVDVQRRLSQVIELIHQSDCDVVALQEVDLRSRRSAKVDQVSALISQAGYRYSHFVTTWQHPWVPYPSIINPHRQFGSVHAGNLILSRYPIVMSSEIPLPQRMDTSSIYRWFYIHPVYQEIVISMPGASLRIGNVHLDAFDCDTRAAQLGPILNKVSESTIPVIIAGDFNSIGYYPHSKQFSDDPEMDYGNDVTMTLMAEAGFVSCGYPEDVVSYDFPSWSPNRRLSYVMAKGIRAGAIVACPAIEASDHRALIGEIGD